MELMIATSPSYVAARTLPALRVELLEDWAAIEALKPEWNPLLHKSHAESIFLTWQWVRCWADIMGPSVRPLVVSVRDARGDLVGLAPLYHATFRLSSVVSYRVLRVMADYPTGADYPDWIVRCDADHEITSAIVEALDARRGWDCIWMPRMAGWTGSIDRIVAACRSRHLPCRVRPQDFSYFDLPSDKATYFQSLSKNKRQQLRAEVKRITARPTVDMCRCDTEEELPQFLQALFDLHDRRWSDKGEAGAFKEEPLEKAFYRRFTREALRKGWLWLIGLRDQGEFKAIQIGYVYRNVFHQLQEGFDPAYFKGVGNVLRAHVIESCIAQGVEGYDFLGEMSEHKRRWLGQQRPGGDVLIGRSTLKNLPLLNGVWPSCRFMRQVSPQAKDGDPS